MHIVHSNIGGEEKPKAKRVSRREARVDAWIARFHQRSYDRAVKENAAEIAEIQKYIPGWMPVKK
jgi:hypothetical protein